MRSRRLKRLKDEHRIRLTVDLNTFVCVITRHDGSAEIIPLNIADKAILMERCQEIEEEKDEADVRTSRRKP